MHGLPFAKGKSKIHVAKHIKLGALGKERLQVRSSLPGGLWPGLGAAAALLQAIAWEEGAKMGAWLAVACISDPEESCCKQIALEEPGGQHPAVSALPS